MPSPFPGLDPYLEAQGHWPDFHLGFLAECRAGLNEVLPEAYAARLNEIVRSVGWGDDPGTLVVPDVLVVRESARPSVRPEHEDRPVALIEPVTIPYPDVEEPRTSRWLEILRLPEQRVVTVIEVLSPSNKEGKGRIEYLAKRVELLSGDAHLIELDLLLAGRRLPMGGPLPPGDLFAYVSRTQLRPDGEVYAWSVRHPLPAIPVPLDQGDPDVSLDLAALFAITYDRARYRQVVNYSRLLDLPLAPADREWAEEIARSQGRRP